MAKQISPGQIGAGRPGASNSLRAGLLAGALTLGAVGIWLIVASNTQKQTSVGVLVGLWGLFLGWYVGGRRTSTTEADDSTTALELPEDVHRQRGFVQRREFELRLLALAREEFEDAVRTQLVDLRREIAELRRDRVEGQITLERTETTRLIGSDLEALQNEVRQLGLFKAAAVSTTRPTFDPPTFDPPASAAPALDAITPPTFDAQVVVQVDGVLPAVESSLPGRAASLENAAPPVDAKPDPPSPKTAGESPRVEPTQSEDRPGTGATAGAPRAAAGLAVPDFVANLPRLSRFVDEDPETVPAAGHRHAVIGDDAAVPRQPADPTRSVGRRRRADDEPNEVLTRLLGR